MYLGLRGVLGPGWTLAGCTTYSELTEAGFQEDSVSALLLWGDDLRFGVGRGEGVAADPGGALERAWAEARSRLGIPPTAAFVLPDASLSMQGEAVVEALARLGGGVLPVAGGCPEDGPHFKRPLQILDGDVRSDAALVVLFGAPLRAQVVARSGWTPIGDVGVATRTEGPKVLTIDDRPAIEFVKRYLGTANCIPKCWGPCPWPSSTRRPRPTGSASA